ncbi:peptidoglycan editing factor PgeF [Gracilibacillus kekensis]|uniref:Purine nucleoside phosphorylase n=1 Tax=Gracilibacillus kekensis TaxID=1027249 RepID=A0A1M7PDW7_9BACI|nr:peptidoglycan editing factor PgeF [Gracilibacillus kekensis]SHN15187.1 conserved hypothetical protein [Gracilibacillus kekensis]
MSEPFFQKNNDPILWVKPWEDANIVAGFTTREKGRSLPPYHSNNLGFHVEDNPDDVLQNRKQVAEHINIPLNQWVMADQVHDNYVQFVNQKHKGRGIYTKDNALEATDGLITSTKNVMCTALYADCVPLYFFDRKNRTVAIAHAGWKGTVANIAKKTIEQFKEKSSYVEDIEVVIGPSICKTCYQVNDHVIQHIDPKYSDCYEGKNNNYHLDLKKLNQNLLLDEGIQANNIHITNYCTSHHSLFFSHRREQHPTGRMMGFIAIL